MLKSKKQASQCDPLPEEFGCLKEFWGFWETHSTADYEDLMEDVNVNVNIRASKVYCAVAKDIITQLRTQAYQQGISMETLINLWLREKVVKSAHSRG